jgi:hypothetical protein
MSRKAQRRNGATAQWRNGAMAQRLNGAKDQRRYGTNVSPFEGSQGDILLECHLNRFPSLKQVYSVKAPPLGGWGVKSNGAKMLRC